MMGDVETLGMPAGSAPRWRVVELFHALFSQVTRWRLVGFFIGLGSPLVVTIQRKICGDKSAKERDNKIENQKIRQQFEKQITELSQELTAEKHENDRLRWDIADLRQENIRLQERSDELTREMARRTDDISGFEATNDWFSNTKLSARFENDLHANKWFTACESLGDDMGTGDQEAESEPVENQNTARRTEAGLNTDDDVKPNLTEVEQIAAVSDMLQEAYALCVAESDRRLRQFLALEDQLPLPDPCHDQDLYRIRRLKGQESSCRMKIQEAVSTTIRQTHLLEGPLEKVSEETRVKLESLLMDFIDCSWLMTISQPRLVLNFDVKDKQYMGVVRERFRQYATQNPVVDSSLKVDTVTCVVWPSVEQADGPGLLKKGEVITASPN